MMFKMALPRERWSVWLSAVFLCPFLLNVLSVDVEKCEELRLGQYICDAPKISDITQEPENCTNNTASVPCIPAPNITCRNHNNIVSTFSGKEIGFYKPIPCRNVTGYSYKVAVALSLFLGWLGADRFYLGYPALGLLKFCTVGFCGIGSLIDFVLISVQGFHPSFQQVMTIILIFICVCYSAISRVEQGMTGLTFHFNISRGVVRCFSMIVGPADGSNYIIDYYGARLTRLSIDNDTYRKRQTDM